MPANSTAYSYLRFSTPEQAAGDSFRRQSELAASYASSHGLTLSKLSYEDLGVSAYRGRNAETGALRAFLNAVEAGDVKPGSVLLVEALDRISRRTARKAIRVLEDIVEAGIDLVTLNDGKRYTVESLDGMDFVMAILFLIRGHEESKTKGRRVRAAWQNKRKHAADRPLTVMSPGWIEIRKTGDREWSKPKLIADRANVVRRIFDQFLAGKGKEAIARSLNEDEVKPFGRANHWHKSYVSKILNNPAVIGVFTPHEMREGKRVALDPIKGYFPAAVGVSRWRRAQTLLRSSHKTKARNGEIRNVLAGLAKCPSCGATMTRVMKGSGVKGGKPKLVCSAAKAGAKDLDGSRFCQYRSIPLEQIEEALKRNAGYFSKRVPNRNEALQVEIDVLEGELYELNFSLSNLVDALAESPSKTVADRIGKLETESEEIRIQLEELKSKASETDSNVVRQRVERLDAALSGENFEVARTNAAMRECFSSVVVDYDAGDLLCKWRHTDQSKSIVYDPGFDRQ